MGYLSAKTKVLTSSLKSVPADARVRILKPSIDDFGDTAVIRGVIDDVSLPALRTDYYQRELLPSVSRGNILNALESGEKLPDVVLGMRGETFELEGDDLLLVDPVYIIDGQQRCRTAQQFVSADPTRIVRQGAVIHVNTNVAWEKVLFQKLNQYQAKVSPNILLRNNKDDHPLIATMYGLTCSDKTFVLYDRVQWSQGARRDTLMSAVTMLHVISTLHAHIGSGKNYGMQYAVPNSDALVKKIGLPILRANVKAFFNLIDECWGLRRIAIKGGSAYTRRAFMEMMAQMISDHPDFWKDDRRLEIDRPLRRKLALFPVGDPEIVRLASASGMARHTLYSLMINHMNSGKRTKRLLSRNNSVVITSIDEDDETDVDEDAT